MHPTDPEPCKGCGLPEKHMTDLGCVRALRAALEHVEAKSRIHLETGHAAALGERDARRRVAELEETLAVMRMAKTRNPPATLNEGRAGNYIVLRKRETDPWEVNYFDNRDDAIACWDACSAQWSMCYLLAPLGMVELNECICDKCGLRHGGSRREAEF